MSTSWQVVSRQPETPECIKEHGSPSLWSVQEYKGIYYIVSHTSTHPAMGHLGSSFSQPFQGNPIPTGLLGLFQSVRYILWYVSKSLHPSTSKLSRNHPLDLPTLLKESYTPRDLLRAWTHAADAAAAVPFGREAADSFCW